MVEGGCGCNGGGGGGSMATTVVVLPMTSVVVLVKRWGGRSDGMWERDGDYGAIGGECIW